MEEFLRLAKVTHLDVPDNVVSSNLLESELSMAFGGRERLDTFFPFDPCLLMKSDRFVSLLAFLTSLVHFNWLVGY